MPIENPSAVQLWEGEISFFSIDTDLIQAAGYNFEEGVLNQLPIQLPPTMQLQLTDVVANEIVAHQMAPVHKAIQDFKGSAEKLKRLADISMDDINTGFLALAADKTAENLFRRKIEEYAGRCRGGILPIVGEQLAPELFKKYFAGLAPFANRKDKKAEFPDAVSLLLLEQYAVDTETKGIVVSGDKGWSSFAESSDHLYYVNSIDALTALFAATDIHGRSIKARILVATEDQNSELHTQLSDALQNHVSKSSWDIDDIYTSINGRVEADPYDAKLAEYTLNRDLTKVWAVDKEPTTWVIELTAKVKANVLLDVKFFVYDWIDNDEIELSNEILESESEFDVQVFLTCSGIQGDAGPADWDISIEIAPGEYSVSVGDVEPDLSN